MSFVQMGRAATVLRSVREDTPPVVVRHETVSAIVSMGGRPASAMRRLLIEKTAAKKNASRVQGNDLAALPYGKHHARVQGAQQLRPRERDEDEDARYAKATRRRAHAAADDGEQDEQQRCTTVKWNLLLQHEPVRREKGDRVEKAVAECLCERLRAVQEGRYDE